MHNIKSFSTKMQPFLFFLLKRKAMFECFFVNLQSCFVRDTTFYLFNFPIELAPQNEKDEQNLISDWSMRISVDFNP